MKRSELDDLLDAGKFEEAITHQTRKVKWLYKNSNKLTDVVDEKLVRLIVHRMREQEDKIVEWSTELIKKYETYISNIEYHIKYNKPPQEEIKKLNSQIAHYSEIVTDLKLLPEQPIKSVENWESALVSLTPGGSEFAGDPEYCVKWVKEFQESQHQFIAKLIKEKNQ